MSQSSLKATFCVLDACCFLALTYLITGWQLNWAWFSVPLLFAAQSFFFGMLFANVALDGHEEEEQHEAEARAGRRISWQHVV